jgi:hypothetical protein
MISLENDFKFSFIMFPMSIFGLVGMDLIHIFWGFSQYKTTLPHLMIMSVDLRTLCLRVASKI